MRSVASSVGCRRSSKARVCVEAVTLMWRIDAGVGGPPAGWSAPNLGYAIPPQSFLWPADSAVADMGRGEASRPSIKKGDAVKDRDGDVVGVVEDIRFDEKTGEVLSLTVKAGTGLERLFGGSKVAEISRDDILRIAEGEVRLGVDREEIVPREHETGTR